jgi:hypothetical protein
MQMPLLFSKIILALANLLIVNISITFNILFFIVRGILDFQNVCKDIASFDCFNKGTEEHPELNTLGIIVGVFMLLIASIVGGIILPLRDEVPKYCKQVLNFNSEENNGMHHSLPATLLLNLCSTNKLTKPWVSSLMIDPNSELALVAI